MTIFTEHPHDQGITYFEHWGFAMGIAWRLLRSVVAFAVHGWLSAVSLYPFSFHERPPPSVSGLLLSPLR